MYYLCTDKIVFFKYIYNGRNSRAVRVRFKWRIFAICVFTLWFHRFISGYQNINSNLSMYTYIQIEIQFYCLVLCWMWIKCSDMLFGLVFVWIFVVIIFITYWMIWKKCAYLPKMCGRYDWKWCSWLDKSRWCWS